MPRLLALAICCSFFFGGPLDAVDLTKVDRTIVKEPAYKSKTPKYCLLVFGPEAKTRVWLVLDGDTLYVDRNGNGDLTEEGERVAAKDDRSRSEGRFTFEVGDLQDGALLHKKFTVEVRQWSQLASVTDEDVAQLIASDPKAPLLLMSLEMEMPPWKGAHPGNRVIWATNGSDHRGPMKLGDKPASAPIIHFGGPWQVDLREKHELTIEREGWLVVHVGTPGLGAGTTAYFGYENVIPGEAHPTVELTYPPARPGDLSIRERYELKERC